MTRRLPWKKSGEHDAATASPRRTIAKKSESPTSLASPARIAIARQTAAPRNRQHRSAADNLRSPSSSPPPEVPAEQFMIPEDERYRMVEDELLQTARRFTTHLHRAEYERLKRLARTQNEVSIREIERPVVGTPTMEARRRHDRVAQRIKQRSVPGEQDSSSPTQLTTGLRGLLDAPRSEDLSLSSLAPRLRRSSDAAPGAQRTRAVSPGIGPSSARISATPARVAASPGVGPSPATISATPIRPAASARQPISSPMPRTPLTPASGSTARSRPILIDGDNEELDTEDPFGMRKRNIRRKQSREQFSSAKRPPPKRDDSMPHFI